LIIQFACIQDILKPPALPMPAKELVCSYQWNADRLLSGNVTREFSCKFDPRYLFIAYN